MKCSIFPKHSHVDALSSFGPSMQIRWCVCVSVCVNWQHCKLLGIRNFSQKGYDWILLSFKVFGVECFKSFSQSVINSCTIFGTNKLSAVAIESIELGRRYMNLSGFQFKSTNWIVGRKVLKTNCYDFLMNIHMHASVCWKFKCIEYSVIMMN